MGEDRRRSGEDDNHGNGAGLHPADGHGTAQRGGEDMLLQRLWQDIESHGPEADAEARESDALHVDATSPLHPDHQLLLQSMAAVERMEAGLHRTRDRNSDRLAACLVVAAKQSGLDRIDHVVLSGKGEHAFAVQGDMGSPFRRIVRVETGAAIQTPVDRSLRAIEVVNEALEAGSSRQEPGREPRPEDGSPSHDQTRATTPTR